MRHLKPDFLSALKKECDLLPLLELVKSDSSLCLELRDTYISVYYRGGSLMEVTHGASGPRFHFDKNYGAEAPEPTAGVKAWLDAVPHLKHAMDLHEVRSKSRSEREAQQLLLRENNGLLRKEKRSLEGSTDYYICDIEYRSEQGRFDMVGVHWPSTDRRRATDRRLVFVEVKYGAGALEDPAGLASHIKDINCFLSDAERVQCFKEDMRQVFNQKLDLGIIDCGKPLESFGEKCPLILLVLINQDPDVKKLRDVLRTLPKSPNAEVLVANSSPMGYGLWESRMFPLDVYIRGLNTRDGLRLVG